MCLYVHMRMRTCVYAYISKDVCLVFVYMHLLCVLYMRIMCMCMRMCIKMGICSLSPSIMIRSPEWIEEQGVAYRIVGIAKCYLHRLARHVDSYEQRGGGTGL